MSSGTSMAELGIRLVGSLALVVGLMLLIARGVNKRFQAPKGAAIQVVHRQSIGRGTGVAVVSVGTRVLVLGTTEQQVTLLAEVEPEEVGIDLTTDLAEVAEVADSEYEAGQIDLDSPAGDGEPEQAAARTASSLVRRAVPLGGPLASAQGPLAGSVLSPATWKQTFAAVTGQKAS